MRFRTKEGKNSGMVFQVTHARKPLASVSKIVQRGNTVVFSPQGSYIKNLETGQKINIEEANGTYHIDVDYILDAGEASAGFTRQA